MSGEPRPKAPKVPRDPWGRPLRPVSIKRRQQWKKRSEVRLEVISRAGGRCEALGVIPDHECQFYPPDRPGLEVDEKRGGSYRSTEWLDPDSAQALCPKAHDWKHANPEAARECGLKG